jgi:hypothetical protein
MPQYPNGAIRNREQVIEWGRANVSLSEIARRLHCRKANVKTVLLDADIPLPVQRLDMENNPHWKGGKMLDKQGYVLVRAPGHPLADSHHYVREHRLIAEQMLGRPLEPGEVVHHLNDNVADNRPENLAVFPSNRDHLAETLQGKCPNWTPEGRARTLEGVRRKRSKRPAIPDPSIERVDQPQ